MDLSLLCSNLAAYQSNSARNPNTAPKKIRGSAGNLNLGVPHDASAMPRVNRIAIRAGQFLLQFLRNGEEKRRIRTTV